MFIIAQIMVLAVNKHGTEYATIKKAKNQNSCLHSLPLFVRLRLLHLLTYKTCSRFDGFLFDFSKLRIILGKNHHTADGITISDHWTNTIRIYFFFFTLDNF